MNEDDGTCDRDASEPPPNLVDQWRDRCARDLKNLLDTIRASPPSLPSPSLPSFEKKKDERSCGGNLTRTGQAFADAVTLMVEADLLGPLRLVLGEDLSFLQAHGVSKLVPLHHPDSCWDLRQLLLQGKKEDEDDGGESSSWLSASYVVYLVRPVPAWTRVIAAHVEQHARLTHAWPTSLAAASSTPAPNTLSYLVSSSEGALPPPPHDDLVGSLLKMMADLAKAPAGSTRFGIIFTPQSSVVRFCCSVHTTKIMA